MAKRISPETVQEIIRLRREEKLSVRQIAARVGIHYSTVSRQIKKFQPGGVKGAPLQGPREEQVIDRSDLDGTVEFTSARPKSEAEMMAVWGLDRKRWIPQTFSGGVRETHKKDTGVIPLYTGRISCKRVITEELEAAIVEMMQEIVAPLDKPKIRAPKKRQGKPQAASFGLWDAHIGMYSWNAETGADWDVEKALTVYYNAIDELMDEMARYPIEHLWLPMGNDWLHFDSVRHKTAEGSHDLDVDTRFARCYIAALKIMIYQVQRAIEQFGKVKIILIGGNHDATTAFTLVMALMQRFMNDPRVTFDVRPIGRKYERFGGCLLGWDHGAYNKPQRLALNLLTEPGVDRNGVTYREVQVGHRHQQRDTMLCGVTPTNGVMIRMNGSLCNADIWHARQGFTDPIKTCEAWRYDHVGFKGSHVHMQSVDCNPNIDQPRVIKGGPNWRENLPI